MLKVDLESSLFSISVITKYYKCLILAADEVPLHAGAHYMLPRFFEGSTTHIAQDPCSAPQGRSPSGARRGRGRYMWYYPRRSIVTILSPAPLEKVPKKPLHATVNSRLHCD